MPENDDTNGIDAMDRLERALDRIEAHPRPSPVIAEVATRLDAVIARLRAELEA